MHPVLSITISGNQRTKDFVILREMLVQTDSLYAQIGERNIDVLLKRSTERILNLNLFNQVITEKSQLNTAEGYGYAVTVQVTEKWFVWPIPFVEFSDRNFNVWGNLDFDPDRTNYGLYVFNYNAFGRNHTVKTRMKTGYNTELGLEYRIPFLSKNTNWGLNTKVNYTSQNEVWYETTNDSLQFYRNGRNNLFKNTQAHIELTKRIKPYLSMKYGLYFEHGELDSSVTRNDYFINNQQFQRKYSAHFNIEFDKRNNIYLPTQGKYGFINLGGNMWQNGTQTFNGSLESKLQRFDKLSKKWYSALSIYVQLNTNDKAPYSDRKLLGYNEIVRGFEHYVIDGTVGWKTNAAIRYHLIEKNFQLNFIPVQSYQILPANVYLEGYIDGGYANYQNSKSSNTLNGQSLYSVGLGLNTLLYNDRLLRLEYSLNSLAEGGFFVHFKKAI